MLYFSCQHQLKKRLFAILVRKLVILVVLTFADLVSAESFRIESDENDGWDIDVRGSVTVKRIAGGMLLNINALTVRARFLNGNPLYITGMRFSGSDRSDGESAFTTRMYSERVPIGKWLIAGETLSLQISKPIFMRNPDWHQKEPRYFLDVNIENDGKEGHIPIDTTMHELKLVSNFQRGVKSDVRETGLASGDVFLFGYVAAVVAFFAILYGCKTPRDEVLVGLFLFLFVWMGGIFPGLRFGYSLLWTRTSAQVIDCAVSSSPPKGRQTSFSYTPVIKYQFMHGDVQFSSTQIQLSSRWSSYSQKEAYAALQPWNRVRQAGSSVPVWINPLDPSDSVLERNLSWLDILVRGRIHLCVVAEEVRSDLTESERASFEYSSLLQF